MSEIEKQATTRETAEEQAELDHLERAMAYQAGDLAGEAKAEFEAHLGTCERCQRALAAATEWLPKLGELGPAAPAFTPKRSVEEQVARFDAMVAAERDARRGKLLRRVGLAIAAVVVVAFATVVVLNALHAGPRPQEHLYAPHP
jgi:anti-sigma-K factor RskA